MGLIALLGFKERTCGCVIGRYRELATHREITYVEQRGPDCAAGGHHGSQSAPPDAQQCPAPPDALREAGGPTA